MASPPSLNVATLKTTTSHISKEQFSNLNISKNTLRAIDEKFKYDYMTVVQAQSIHPILEGILRILLDYE